MKKFILLAGVCGCCLAAEISPAAPSPKAGAAAQKSAAPAAARAEPEIPASVFVWPANPKEGKDPFFPGSKRPYAGTVVKQPVTNAPVTLTLNGISRGLAMINGRTFSQGEEGDVNTNAGKRHVRCIKIKEDSAIIELLPEGERQELKLRGGL